MSTRARLSAFRFAPLVLLVSTGCASLLGLDNDYREASSGGGASVSGGHPGNEPGAGNGTGATAGTVPEAGAASGRVIQGKTDLPAGTAQQEVAVGALDLARALLVFGTSFDSTSSSLTEVSGQLTAASTAVFRRTSSQSTAPRIPIVYYVAELPTGASVQRGSSTLSSALTEVQLPQAVNPEHSFPIVTFRNVGSVYGLDDHVRAKLTSSTQLSFEMAQASGEGVVEWQVVSLDGASVQSADVDVPGNALESASPLAAPVDPTHTWLLLSYQVADIGAGVADLMLRGRVEPGQVVFERAASGASAKLTYYAVSFSGGTSVNNVVVPFTAEATNATASLAGLDTTRAFAVASGSYLRGGATSYATSKNPGMSSFTLSLDANGLQASRGAKGATADLTVGVIQFE